MKDTCDIKMKKINGGVWDWMILFGALLILVWAFLKAIGAINTPTWVEMIPYFGGGLSILGGAYKLGKIKQGIDHTNHKVNQILEIEQRFNKIENEHNLAMDGKLKMNH